MVCDRINKQRLLRFAFFSLSTGLVMYPIATEQGLPDDSRRQRMGLWPRLMVVSGLLLISTLPIAAQAEDKGHVQRLLMTRFCNRCNLKDANLAGKDLQGARLTDTKLKRANLAGANLRFAILRNVNLNGADLTNADLTGAMLQNVNFKGAILDGAKLPISQELNGIRRPSLPTLTPKIRVKP
ncbi:MAG: pentapeptide repeat-containing protein [Thermosynechococcaceae cyanobacterium]